MRDFVYKESGMFFTERNRNFFETKVKMLLKDSRREDIFSYIKCLSDMKSGHQEKTRLLNAITINETSFFRDNTLVTALSKNVIPAIVERKAADGDKNINVWSAACSSGDEAYTAAILFCEHLQNSIGQWKVRVYATDINENALAICRNGVYNDYSLRNMSKAIKDGSSGFCVGTKGLK